MQVDSVPLIVVAVVVLIAAVTDLREFKIRDVITFPLLISGLAYHAVVGGVGQGGFGVLVALALVWPGYRLGGVGGGDVKLMAGVGAWLGPLPTVGVYVAASLAAGLYALVAVLAGGRVRETWANLKALVRGSRCDAHVREAIERRDRLGLVPFGAMIGVGLITLVVMTFMRSGS